MNTRRIVPLLALTLLLAGCAGMPGQESAVQEERRLLCEELREAEDEQHRLQQLLANLQRQLREEQRKSEEAQQKLQHLLAERQRQLREEQRKLEELQAKFDALRGIDRDLRRRAPGK